MRLTILIFFHFLSISSAIKCNFTFEEDFKDYPQGVIDALYEENDISEELSLTITKHGEVFDCDDFFDGLLSFDTPTTSKGTKEISSVGDDDEEGDDDDDDDDEGGDELEIEIAEENENRDEATGGDFNKSDDDVNSQPFCESIRRIITPSRVSNIHNKLVTVAHHGRIKQRMIIEQCKHQNATCLFNAHAPLGYITFCRQKYLTHIIDILDEVDNTIHEEPIYYPSGCECRFKTTT